MFYYSRRILGGMDIRLPTKSTGSHAGQNTYTTRLQYETELISTFLHFCTKMTTFSSPQLFQLYRGGQFYWWGKHGRNISRIQQKNHRKRQNLHPQVHDHSLYWIDSATLIKSGRIKLVFPPPCYLLISFYLAGNLKFLHFSW